MNYENYDDERADRMWNLFRNAIIIIAITALTIGYFTIDFTKFNNIKTEQIK